MNASGLSANAGADPANGTPESVNAARCAPRSHVGPLELRRRDRRSAQVQCQACYSAVGRRVELVTIDAKQLRDIRPWSARPRPTRPQNARRRAYVAFLHTAHWREQRLRVLERDRWRCQGANCGASLRPPARATVHHLEYAEDLYAIPDEKLRASCVRCNVNEKEQRLWA